MRWGVAIVAAGRGERFGGPKQLAQIAGRPMIAWSISTFGAMPEFVDLAIATEPEYVEAIAALAVEYAPRLSSRVVTGGATRQESVRAALRAIPERCAAIAVHDGARPLVLSRDVRAAMRVVRRGTASLARGAGRRHDQGRRSGSQRRACGRWTAPNCGRPRRRSAPRRTNCAAPTATPNATASRRPTTRPCSNGRASMSSSFRHGPELQDHVAGDALRAETLLPRANRSRPRRKRSCCSKRSFLTTSRTRSRASWNRAAAGSTRSNATCRTRSSCARMFRPSR